MTKFKLFLYKNVKRGGKGKLKLLKLGIKEGSLLTLQKFKKKITQNNKHVYVNRLQ